MQIITSSKIPKIISGIVVTISIIAFDWIFLPPFWFWVSLEIIAALLVAVGCIGEWWLHHHPAGRKKKDKDEHHKIESRLIATVAVGVTMELFALGHSIKESAALENEFGRLETTNLVLRSNVAVLELQVMEASNNIVKNDVHNWPISEVSAVAWFTVMGTNMDVELTNLPSGRKAQMSLWKNEREGFSLDSLEAGNGDIWGHVLRPTFGLVDRRIYRVQLHSFNFLAAEGINPPLVKTIDDIHLVRVDLNFLPRDSEIANGRIILTLNNVTKYFDVPTQNDTNSIMSGWNDFTCLLVATNGIQTSEKTFLYLRH